jgi:hypothetical protein
MKCSTIFLLMGLAGRGLVAAEAEPAASPPAGDNAELRQIYEEDQADRKPPIDWKVVSDRDGDREQRVKVLLAEGALRTGADFYHAAMVLQHAPTPNDYLLCHDLCVIAIGKGEERAKWLAAASLDRFLVSIDRPQRFGTQYGANRPNQPMRLRTVDPAVTDELRRAFNVPTLAEAKAREAQMLRDFETKQQDKSAPAAP